MKYALTICAFILFFIAAKECFCADEERFLISLVPVADIRSAPGPAKAGYAHDNLDETQVLYNEILLYKGEAADWYKVEAIEQKEFSHNGRWQGYPGWIRKDCVGFVTKVPFCNITVDSAIAAVLEKPESSARVLLTVCMGTKFEATGEKGNFYKVALAAGDFGWIAKDKVRRVSSEVKERALREEIIEKGRLFLNVPYLWAGRSYPFPSLKGVAAGVDCSGLVNIVFRACAVDIARDAHEQWMLSKRIRAEELKPADLIFVSKKDDFEAMGHVMLFLGEENFIEAPGTGSHVCVGNFKKKFGLSLKELKEKDFFVEGKKVYFGRILP